MVSIEKIVAVVLIALLSPIPAFAADAADASLARIRQRLTEPAPIFPWLTTADQIAAAAQDSACPTSRLGGNDDAGQRHGTAGWFIGGIGAGIGLGLISLGGITGGAALESATKSCPAGHRRQLLSRRIQVTREGK